MDDRAKLASLLAEKVLELQDLQEALQALLQRMELDYLEHGWIDVRFYLAQFAQLLNGGSHD